MIPTSPQDLLGNIISNAVLWCSLSRFQPSLLPQHRKGLKQLHQHIRVQGLEVLEDELVAQLLQLLSTVFLGHLGNFQNIIPVCVLGEQ